MGYTFNVDEIFEIAENIERNGADFYRKAAETVSDARAKRLLLDLAAMEDEHEKTFVRLRSDLASHEKGGTVFDPEGQAVLYLKALADTRVFFEKELDVSSLEKIYASALAAEKDSIVFYLGMKDLVPEDLGKKRIDAIIKEEMAHIRLLGRDLVELKKQ